MGAVPVKNGRVAKAKKRAFLERDRERHKTPRYREMARARYERERSSSLPGEKKQADIRSYATMQREGGDRVAARSAADDGDPPFEKEKRWKQTDIRACMPGSARRDNEGDESDSDADETDLLFSLTVGNEKAKEHNLAQLSASILSNSKRIFFDRIHFLLDCLSTKEAEGLYTGTYRRAPTEREILISIFFQTRTASS